ncbi:MAG: 50S ribosomal protein L32, partial [Candidatus Kerfeldbacteria bacterium CG08_land_8_20_14_0_20_42_7]
CPKCKKPARPHRICPNCGYYKGRDILQKDLKAERKKKRVKKHEQKSTS